MITQADRFFFVKLFHIPASRRDRVIDGSEDARTEIQAIADHRQLGRNEALAIVTRWQDSAHMRLHAGEMTAQERRTVKAVLAAVAREIAGGEG